MNIWQLLIQWHEMQIWKKVIIGLVLGILTGLVFGESTAVLKPLGDAFINSLHMVVVPVILSAVICAVTSVSDIKEMRRVTIKTFIIYIALLSIASIIAILVGNLLSPGIGLSQLQVDNNVNFAVNSATAKTPDVLDVIVGMIPKNPMAAFVNQNILQIVVFGILFGIAINLSGEHGKPVVQLFHSISQVSTHLTNIVMYFAPYGVFALIAWTFGLFGLKALWPLIKFIAALLLGCLSLALLYSTVIVVYLKKSAFAFFKKIAPALVFALSTTSSGATLPVSMRCAEEELGIAPRIARFTIPLGCNFNLAGLSVYLTMAVIFTANMYNITLNFSDYLVLISTVALTTMGAGAIPGSGIVVMSAVISGMGMPLGALPLIAGIDRISDMIQTATNVVSDIFAAYVVSETEVKKIKTVNEISSLDVETRILNSNHHVSNIGSELKPNVETTAV